MKWCQASGARVIPIFSDESNETTLKKMKQINGVLFTGNVAIPKSDGHSFSPLKQEEDKARFIYEQAKKLNDKSIYFPLWGVCQGFHYMCMFSADDPANVVSKLTCFDRSLQMKFITPPANTKMFKDVKDQKPFN